MMNWLRQAGRLAAVECRLQIATPVWRVILGLSLLLAVTMTLASVSDYFRRRNQVDLLVAQRDRAAEDGLHAVSGFQRDQALRVIRNPEMLSQFVSGLDRWSPQYWDFGPEGLSAGSPVSGEPTSSVTTANLDLEFILRSLIGILALVAGFTSMASSRPRGPTKSLVSLPLSRSVIVAGAMAGATLAVALASAAVIATAFLVASTVGSVSTHALRDLLLIWMATILYHGVLVALGTVVALVVVSTSSALAGVAALWLLATTIAGPVIGALVDGLAPSTSRALFEASRNSAYEAGEIGIETEAGNRVLEHLGMLEAPPSYQLTAADVEKIEQHWQGTLRDLRQRLNLLESQFRQRDRARATTAWWLGAFVPGTALGHAISDLAGVGDVASRRWIEAGLAHQNDLSTALFDNRPRLHARLRYGSGFRAVFYDRSPRPSVAALPAFRERGATASERVRDAAPAVVALSTQAVIVSVVAIVIFCRREVSAIGRH